MMGPPQKPGRSKQDYGTPPDFLEAVAKRFGEIRADLAATSANRVAPDFYGDDGNGGSLAQPWAKDHPTGLLWLNPPFGDIGPWAEKCRVESAKRSGLILMLTPASIGSNWFADHVFGNATILALSPRLSFVGTTDPYPKDLMLTVWGQAVPLLECWRWKSARAALLDIDAIAPTSAASRTIPLPFAGQRRERATRCDGCDPSFGCFDGSAPCSKAAPNASHDDLLRAKAFRDHDDGTGTVKLSTNDVLRLGNLLRDVRREAIEACANVAEIKVLRDEPHRIVRNIRNLASMSPETVAKLAAEPSETDSSSAASAPSRPRRQARRA